MALDRWAIKNYLLACLLTYFAYVLSAVQLSDPCEPNPCHGESTCVAVTSSSDGSRLFRCICAPGRTGTSCERQLQADPCFPTPCHNGGTCTSVDGGGDYRCQCVTGYQGRNCDWYNPCLRSDPPCRNGATCTSPISGQYSCMCALG